MFTLLQLDTIPANIWEPYKSKGTLQQCLNQIFAKLYKRRSPAYAITARPAFQAIVLIPHSLELFLVPFVSHSSTFRAFIGDKGITPALLKITSTRPNLSNAK